LPLKFNTSTNTELMKPIPGTLQQGALRGLLTRAVAAKAFFVGSSERVDRDFVFTRGREMDNNETPVAEEFTR
jgi:hypothetical protein